MKRIVLTAGMLIAMGTASAVAGDKLDSNHRAGKYQAGDFHQHSLYTDGSQKFMDVMEENANYGLDWWANSEHGGVRNQDGEGVKWLDTTKYPDNPILGNNPEAGYMYRWQSLRDYVYPDVQVSRATLDKVIINGVEQNVPGHEHCSTAIHQFDGSATAISEWEYRFDRSDSDTSRDGEPSLLNRPELGGVLSKTNKTKEDAILGVKWMQALYESGLAEAWMVPAHVERAHSYKIEDFRAWMDAGPDVALGFEGAPGHQTAGDRGFGRSALGGGTYGGTGFYVATIGGLWDGLLAEGRKFSNFASSDFHQHWSLGGSDFWPGEYQKNYTYINTSAKDPIRAVFEGNRSGNTWNVQGDLIDMLEFTALHENDKAVMGETLLVEKGDEVRIKIRVHDPNSSNNCPLDMDNPSLAQIGVSQPLSMPVLDHIDLIGASITDRVPMTSYPDYETTDYGTDAKVIVTFKRHGDVDKEGYLTYVTRLEIDDSMFLRLRGTNLPAEVPFETDAKGNPQADSLANDNIYASMDPAVLETQLFNGTEIRTNSKLDEVAEAYADLWFYSNPIFIKVVEKEQWEKHHKKDHHRKE